MYIKDITLENFAGLKVGSDINKLHIDFSSRRNKICLLLAPNGSGKSVLMSMLTPFATVGNLDVRDSAGLIIKGLPGYKEITIVSGNDEYLIKHYYTPKDDSHTTKSYISKNDDELNPNGNVRSFLAIVEEELGLQPNFLKLIRLGNNVTNLLQLSATERKKFLSNLLEDLDIYLDYYKKLTDDARILKTQISHTQDKLTKTGIDDIDLANQLLSHIDEELQLLNDKNTNALTNLGKVAGLLSTYNYDELKNTYNSLNKKITKARKALDDNKDITKSEVDKRFSDEEKRLRDLNDELVSKKVYLSTEYSNIDRLLNESSSVSNELKKEESNTNIESAKNIYTSLKVEIGKKESTFANYKVAYTKEDIDNLLSSLLKIRDLLLHAYEFGTAPVQKVTDLLSKKVDVNNYVNNGLLNLANDNGPSSRILNKLLSGANAIPLDCKSKDVCGMYKLWEEIRNLQKEELVTHKNDETPDFLNEVSSVHNILTEVLDILSSIKDTIMLLPDNLKSDFTVTNIFKHINKLEMPFDLSKYNVIETEITEYQLFLDNKKACEEAEAKYKLLLSTSNIKYLNRKLDEINDELLLSYKTYDNLKDVEIPAIENRINTLTSEHETTSDLLVAITELNDLVKEFDKCSDDINNYNSLLANKVKLDKELSEITYDLKKKSDERYNVQRSIDSYISLQKDMKKYEKLYDTNSYIKRSMSAKEGMPLEFINIYMGGVLNIINELLDIVYDGDLRVTEFKINSDEFRIPYIKNRYISPDIVQASQGETAFLSIALSFALISKSILKYNIVLLDEIDGNLDSNNRKKFIAILERLIDMISSEQVFLISHNNLFSMYPVDVVSLNGDIDTSLQLANYIPIFKE